MSNLNDPLTCGGFRSCMGAQIFVTGNAYFTGAFSAQDSTIKSNGNTTVYFYGSQAGNGALMICYDGHECNIHCHADACDELTLVPYSGSIVNLNCSSDAHLSTVCSTGLQSKETYEFEEWPSLMEMAFTLEENNLLNSYEPCDSSLTGGSKRCMDADECHDQEFRYSGPICCSGRASCQSSTVTSLNITGLNNNTYINQVNMAIFMILMEMSME